MQVLPSSAVLLSAAVLAGCAARPAPTPDDVLRSSAPVAGAPSCDVTGSASIPATISPGLADGPHTLIVDGVRLWYCVAGRGAPDAPPVVFLHGGPGQGSHHAAALAGDALETSLRIVYFDQRGSGRSERPWTREYSIDRLVGDIEALRLALGVPRIVVLGHSFGGTLALEYAAKHPAQTAGIVFVAGLWDAPGQMRLRCDRTFARFPDVATRVLGDSAAARQATGDCDWFWQLPQDEREALNNALMFPDPAVRIRLDSTVDASGLRNTHELSSALFTDGLLQYRFDEVERLAMPVLIIAGRHDDGVPGAGLRALASRLPAATFVEYERSGHFVYLDEPERFAEEVARFVGRL